MTIPMVRALVTGTPPHDVTQAEARALAQELFPRLTRFSPMLAVFDNAQVEHRQLARPLDWYRTPRTFPEKNAAYVEAALELGERLGREALERAGVAPADVDAVVFVSSTGISTPSLDSHLMARLGIDPHAARVPLWGLGCAGGAGGLARAADLVRAGHHHVLLIAVELCSLTLVTTDESKSSVVGTALFADGGAAAVLGADDGTGLVRVVGARSTLVPGTADMTGWEVVDEGLKLVLSRDIPGLVVDLLGDVVDDALTHQGWARADVREWVVHPGGTKVLAAYEQALAAEPSAFASARAVLRDHGNMSSPTVLFVLEEALRRGATGRGVLSATGPGFSAEHVLLEFG